MSERPDWNRIKNDYVSGNISYRKLAEKYNVSFNTLQDRAKKEKWFDKRKKQRDKVTERTLQKSAEKLAEMEANRLARISNAADKLLEKIELATEQLDLYLSKDKRKYTKQVKDKTTGKTVYVDIEEEIPKSVKANRIDKAGLKQIASALKDLKDIQLVKDEDKPEESPNISINIVAATPNDMEEGD